MPTKKDRYLLPFFILITIDVLVFAGSFILAFGLRFTPFMVRLVPPPQYPPFEPYFILSLSIAALGIFVFERFGFYSRRYGLERATGPIGLVAAVVVVYIFVMAALFNYRGISFSRLTVAFALPMTTVLVCGAHFLLVRMHDLMVTKGIGFRRTVLVGPYERCRDMMHRLRSSCGSEFHIVGYVESGQEEISPGSPSILPCLGVMPRLRSIVKENAVDDVIIALPSDNAEPIQELIDDCTEGGLAFHVVPDIFDLLMAEIDVGETGPVPSIALDDIPLTGPARFIKRTVDLVVAGTVLVIISPVLATIATLIKLDSRGEVIFTQNRVGKDGRTFTMFKFRSMAANAEADTGPVWAKSDDPRCTRVGRWLRRSNLDELPQLLNVVRGDMSIVGPRPERPYFVNKFKGAIPHYMRRHMVKSGITGWAQVNGLRGDTSVEERTEYDMYYVENWTLLLDLQIVWRTLTSYKNAY